MELLSQFLYRRSQQTYLSHKPLPAADCLYHPRNDKPQCLTHVSYQEFIILSVLCYTSQELSLQPTGQNQNRMCQLFKGNGSPPPATSSACRERGCLAVLEVLLWKMGSKISSQRSFFFKSYFLDIVRAANLILINSPTLEAQHFRYYQSSRQLQTLFSSYKETQRYLLLYNISEGRCAVCKLSTSKSFIFQGDKTACIAYLHGE